MGEHRRRVLGLDRRDEDVARVELEFTGVAHRGDRQGKGAVRGFQPKAMRAERVEMPAAGHQHDLMPAGEQPAADGPADRARTDDDVPHWPHSGSPPGT